MDVAGLLESIPIRSEEIMVEAANQPNLFIQAARFRVAKMRALSQASAELEFHRSDAMKQLRRSRKGKKTTEGAFKEMVDTLPETLKLEDRVMDCRQEDEFSKLLIETFRQRSKSIQIIAEAEFYEGRSGTAEISKIEQKRMAVKMARERHKMRSEDGTDEAGEA